MNQLKLNEHGLSESLESVLAQINALANVAHFTISNASASIYLEDAAQLLVTIKNLAAVAEQYRNEWEDLIPRSRR
jgi:hypothetical protein